MDTQTRHALKKDKFAQAAASERQLDQRPPCRPLRWVIVAAGVLVASGVAALVYWSFALGQPPRLRWGRRRCLYNSAGPTRRSCERRCLHDGGRPRKRGQPRVHRVAHDYAGVGGRPGPLFCRGDLRRTGQNDNGETELKAAAGSSNRDLSNLAKLALAGLYHQTTATARRLRFTTRSLPSPRQRSLPAVAQLALADLYVAEGKQDLARAVWAKVKDADKDGAAGTIAAQKLNPKQ